MKTFHLSLPAKKQRDTRRFASRRAALSTLELLVSISIASVLTLGLSGAVFVASKSLQVPEQSTETRLLVGNDYGRLRETISESVGFSTSSAQRVEFTVPDRTGDGVNDQIVYSLANNDLIEQTNNTARRMIGRDVKSLNMRTSIIQGSQATFKQVRFVNASKQTGRSTRQAGVFFPSGSTIGDLLILVVATDKVVSTPSTNPNDWNFITSHSGTNGTLTAWYKFISPSESSVSVNLSTSTDVVTAILQFENTSLSQPICSRDTKSETVALTGPPATAPSVHIPSPGGIVLQFLTTNKNAIAHQNSGLSSHMTCLYEESRDLALVCSTNQAGTNSGVFDTKNMYRFATDTDYIAVSIGLAAE